MTPRMRVMRGVARAFVLCLLLVIGGTVAAVVVSQTAWFRQWLRGIIVQQSANYLNGSLSIGQLEGNLFSGLALRDVALSLDGQPLVAVRAISLRYNLWQLVTSDLTVDEVVLDQPKVALRQDAAGWSVARLVKQNAQEADREGPARPLTIDRIAVLNGELQIEPLAGTPDPAVRLPRRVDAITLEASLTYAPVDIVASISRLSLRTTSPDLEVRSLTGSIAVKDELIQVGQLILQTDAGDLAADGRVEHYLSDPAARVSLKSAQLPLPAVARFVPAMGPTTLQPTLDLSIDGPLSGATIKGTTTSSLGNVAASLLVDAVAPGRSLAGSLTIGHLDLSAATGRRDLKSDITGDLNLDLEVGETEDPLDSLAGTLSANASVAAAGYAAERIDLGVQLAKRSAAVDLKAFAYGARLTSKGRLTLPASGLATYDLRGAARGVNVRALPLPKGSPRVPTRLSATYRVRGAQPTGDAPARLARTDIEATLEESTIPGATIRQGTTAAASLRGGTLGSYQADATLAGVNLFEVGQAFDVAALRDERYRSSIDAHIVAEGRGTTVETLAVDTHGEITEAQILGGTISQLAFSGGVHGGAARLTANGAFAGFDPGAISGREEARGQVGGDLVLEARVSDLTAGMTPENVAGTARVMLDAPSVGGLTFTRAALDADYEQNVATIRELVIEGRDLNLDAAGTLALGDEGNSALHVRADSPNLADVGRIAGVDLSGIARVEGDVSGNRQALEMTGTVEGDGLKFQENGALTLRSRFTARVPQLQWEAVAVTADSSATFVTLGGQNINELKATTTYEAQRVAFSVQAAQPQRELEAAGAVTLHTDHQEVHLDSLAMTTAGQRWEAPAGEAATIRYGQGAVGVEALRLVNGDQEIRVEGQVGVPEGQLQATVSNVDLASVEALLLRPPQFSGLLNAEATVSGPTDALSVASHFAITGGGFRQFTYESLAGDVDYDGKGLTLDARLQQSASQWLSAKGYLPVSMFSAPAEDGAATPAVGDGALHILPATPADRVDLTIDSSPLGLGLLQGFTTALSEVDGTLEAHVRVTGSARDPHPEGTVTIANGKMLVEPTGVSYSNIAGKIELQPDRVHINHIVALDNHQSSVSLTGDLAVHARELSGVQLWINAEDFKVLDNKMGNVRVQSAMQISGSLTAPTIEGDLGISTGRISLDEFLAAVGSSPYATTPTDYLTSSSTPVAQTDATPAQSPVDAAPAAVETERKLASQGPRRTGEEAESTSLMDGLKMNIRFTIPDDLIVRAESLQAPGGSVSLGSLNVTLGGDLNIRKESRGAVQLVGEVNTVRGNYDFQGRRFEILREGTVRFVGGDGFDPLLNLRTRREIQAVEARVDVRGTLSAPEIILSSTPPLEQADILSLIVFNQPINQLGLGEQVSLAARAQSLATGVVASQLASSIGNALNLDTFEIEIGADSGAAAQVTLGQQLGRALFLKVEQGIGDVSSTNVIVEYAFSRWLRLQTNLLQGGTLTQASMFRRQQGSGIDLIVLFTK